MQTFPPIVTYLSNLSLRDRIQIFMGIEENDFNNVLKLPGSNIEMFFNMLDINVRQNSEYNPFKVTMAKVENNPFYELENVDKLR
jgi:hypothetical protein